MTKDDFIVETKNYLSNEQLSPLSGNKIIIDCGHIPIKLGLEGYIFGRDDSPSPTELLTLKVGVSLLKRLRTLGKYSILSICFSDTTRYFNDPTKRPELKTMCESGKIFTHLPDEYKNILSGLTKEDCFFSLQTANSNRFTKIIKNVKKNIRSLSNNKTAHDKYNVFFAKDMLDTLFCFSNEFLLDTSLETKLLEGDWWLDEFATLHPTDKIKAPIASLKKFGIISLYSKKTGILCPATYGGLISNFEDGIDHIAIYSRNDDPSIGEKIIRGVISTCVLSSPHLKNKNFLQIILNSSLDTENSSTPEISLLSANSVNPRNISYESLLDIFNKRLSYRYKQFI